ncbi:MAG: hypothetical protein JJU05_19490 [Verrucomicrobia bacterium]|nr:hypothetical protein [Verrucomicrobiota bacterium]
MNWRKCPFEKDQNYLALVKISYLNHQINKNDVLIFKEMKYDPKSEVTRCYFHNVRTGDKLYWHIWDADPAPEESYEKHFKKL